MPSYTQYKRQLSVVVDSSDEDITWITVKGNHIPIKKGQNKGDAIKEFFESKKSGSSKSDKGATSKSAPAKSESKSAGTKTKKEYPHEFETVRKNALANPLVYNHKYTQKSKAEAYKEYLADTEKKNKTKSTPKTPALQKGQVKLHRDIDDRDVIIDPDGAYTFYKNGVKGSQSRSLKGHEGALKELGELGYKQNTYVITKSDEAKKSDKTETKSEKPKEKSTKKSSVHWVDPKKWNDPRSDPWYALYN